MRGYDWDGGHVASGGLDGASLIAVAFFGRFAVFSFCGYSNDHFGAHNGLIPSR